MIYRRRRLVASVATALAARAVVSYAGQLSVTRGSRQLREAVVSYAGQSSVTRASAGVTFDLRHSTFGNRESLFLVSQPFRDLGVGLGCLKADS